MTGTASDRAGLVDIVLRLALIAGLGFACFKIALPFLPVLSWTVLLATMPAPDALADAAAAGWRVAAIATEDDLVDAWTEVVERGARRVAR